MTSVRAWLTTLLLGAIGFGINLLAIPTLPGMPVGLGGAAAILAAVAFGVSSGFVAGAIAGSTGLLVGLHPFEVLILALQPVAVGIFRRRWRPATSVAVYWLAFGVPLLFIGYYLILNVPLMIVGVLLLKDPLIGIVNAFLAEAVLLRNWVRHRLGIAYGASVRQHLTVLAALSATIPVITLLATDIHDDWLQEVDTAHEEARLVTNEAATTVRDFFEIQRIAARELATRLALRGAIATETAGQLTGLEVDLIEALRIDVVDTSGTVLIRGEPTDIEAVAPTGVGESLAGMPFFSEARSLPVDSVLTTPILRDPATGTPTSILVAPIIGARGPQGYIVAFLDLESLVESSIRRAPGEIVYLADPSGTGLSPGPSGGGLQMIDVMASPSYRVALQAIRRGTGLEAYSTSTREPLARVLAQTARVDVVAREADPPGWLVWVEIPHDDLMTAIAPVAIRAELFAIVALIASILLSLVVTRRVNEPLHELVRLTRKFGAAVYSARAGYDLVHRAPAELAALAGSFDTMADRLERALRETEHALREVQRAATNQERFFATAAHDLRTPIGAIAGYVELLEMGIHGELTEEQLRTLRRIRENASHLSELVNDLLDLSRLAAGKLELRLEPVDPAVLIEEAVNAVRPKADEKGLWLRLEGEAGIPLVEVDPLRFKQILLNLLSNAVKFTEAGGVTIRWGRDNGPLGEGGEVPGLYVAVTDTGPGIPVEDQERIFEEFGQTSLGKEKGGTGLGLSISRNLARAMGGELTLESEPGAGSTFTLWLPFRRQ